MDGNVQLFAPELPPFAFPIHSSFSFLPGFCVIELLLPRIIWVFYLSCPQHWKCTRDAHLPSAQAETSENLRFPNGIAGSPSHGKPRSPPGVSQPPRQVPRWDPSVGLPPKPTNEAVVPAMERHTPSGRTLAQNQPQACVCSSATMASFHHFNSKD